MTDTNSDIETHVLDLAATYDTKARTNLDASAVAESDGLDTHAAWFSTLGVAYDQMARELRAIAQRCQPAIEAEVQRLRALLPDEIRAEIRP